MINIVDKNEEVIPKILPKAKKNSEFDFVSQLSASALKTLEDLNKRNSKSTNNRNVINLAHYPYTMKNDVSSKIRLYIFRKPKLF